jgi:hypothetical protein
LQAERKWGRAQKRRRLRRAGVFVGGEPIGPAPLDPVEDAVARSPQRRHVLRQQYQPDRQHPGPEKWEDAQKAAADKQRAGRNPEPERRGPA